METKRTGRAMKGERPSGQPGTDPRLDGSARAALAALSAIEAVMAASGAAWGASTSSVALCAVAAAATLGCARTRRAPLCATATLTGTVMALGAGVAAAARLDHDPARVPDLALATGCLGATLASTLATARVEGRGARS